MADPTPISPPARLRTPWWFRLIRVLLNLALLTLLGLQVFTLVLLASGKHLQLPAFAQRALEQQLQEQGLRVHFSNLEVSPTGALLLRDPQIFLTGTEEPVIEAEYVIVAPGWFTLLWSHRLSFSEFKFGNATFYCPPENSPTGERQPFLSRFGAGLSSQGSRWWRLDYLRGQFLNLEFQAQGNFMLPPHLAAALTPAPGVTAPSLAAQYRRWSRKFLNMQPEFEKVTHPFVAVDIAGEDSGLNSLRIFASADEARPPVPGLELTDAWIRFEASWDGSVFRALTPARAHAQAVRYSQATASSATHEVIATGPIWARLHLAEGKDGIFSGRPSRATVFALSTRLDGFPLDGIEADADLRPWPSLPISAAATHESDWLKISGRANFAEIDGGLEWRGGTVAGHAGLRLETILAASRVQLPARLAALKFDSPLALAGDATISPAGELQAAHLAVRAAGAHFEKIDLNSFRAHTRLTRDEAGGLVVEVTDSELKNRSWQVNGSYLQDLRTDDFHLVLRGDLDPAVLHPYLGQWWRDIWDYVIPGGEWPQADVAYRGNWGESEIHHSVNVYTQISHARARGVLMDDLRLQVEQRPEVLSVYNIVGHAAGGGEIHGGIFWTMKPPYQHFFEERLVFDSTLPLPAVGVIGGPSTIELVRPLVSSTPPAIHFDQRTGGLANSQPHVTATMVHAVLAAPLLAYHVPLDSAIVDTISYAGFTDISHFQFGLAGGLASGYATVASSAAGADELRFSVLLENARHTDFLSAIGKFSVSDYAPISSPAQPAPAPLNPATPPAKTADAILGNSAKPGLLDLALGGKLFLGQPDSLIAAGRLRLDDAVFDDVQLFGALTRMLASINIPLGQISLNDAASDLQIAHGHLRLPNLVVTGPSARINAAGIYNVSTNDVDFNALIFPLGEADSFLAQQFAKILNPFSNAVTLKLHGKIAKPEWDVSMNPLRLFENRTVEGPPIPGYPAKPNGAPDLPPLPAAPSLPVEK